MLRPVIAHLRMAGWRLAALHQFHPTGDRIVKYGLAIRVGRCLAVSVYSVHQLTNVLLQPFPTSLVELHEIDNLSGNITQIMLFAIMLAILGVFKTFIQPFCRQLRPIFAIEVLIK